MPNLPGLSLTRVAVLGAALVVGYLLFTAAGDALLSRRLDQEQQRFEREIAQLERQQAELQAIRDYLQRDEYIEGVARRVLGLVRPGETLVVVSSTAPITPTPGPLPDQTTPLWWEYLYGQ